ncbi:response regulator transcription factor [Ferrimonas aestuarii]|uniref:Response regulator transcription factor n=1 Tax=Ferrimonas aestuarii TaxID=2569539 RepID=A0A4U1BPD2_9GAMM|nr:response regulator [Ferrimonas aestuarii]TKB56058.1 response regulator transcription factor [Ferrimonas aestuarii]
MPNNTPLYLVDDDEAILDSLSFLLGNYGLNPKAFASGSAFLDSVDLQLPGCVILDSKMPQLSGQELHQRLQQQQSPLAVIFLTGHGDVPMAVDAFKQGAFDFFQKPVQGSALAQSIEKAFEYSLQRHQALQQLARIDSLSDRERQLFQLVLAGHTNKQMAETLFVSLRTIEVHRANMMRKLDATNVAELLKYAAIVEESSAAQPDS